MRITKTLKVRIKDKHASTLRSMARSVNLVWNYLNELSHRSIRERGNFLSAYSMQPYTKGVAKELGLHSKTVQVVNEEYVTRRNQFKKSKLSWRASNGARRSLGWVPFKTGTVSFENGQVKHLNYRFRVWDSYGLAGYEFRSGSFNEDSRGRWYLNVTVSVEAPIAYGEDRIGIDLGLKTVATCSDGKTLENAKFYRSMERQLAKAQRAKRKQTVRTINAKVSNRRRDALHKFSRALVNRCQLIVVGDVSPTKLVKTTMAKSVLDAGWGQLKAMLKYKCDHAGVVFKVVNEAYTTQVCSCCGALPDSRPKGIADLGMREWTCDCGVRHDRDVNAAKNILALGHGRPEEVVPLKREMSTQVAGEPFVGSTRQHKY